MAWTFRNSSALSKVMRWTPTSLSSGGGGVRREEEGLGGRREERGG